MARITVHAGDFSSGVAELNVNKLGCGHFVLRSEKLNHQDELIALGELEMVDTASEANVRKLGSAVGWGAVGGALLGPIGLVAGLLAGGRQREEVTFVAKFKDGRKLLATTNKELFIKLQAAAF